MLAIRKNKLLISALTLVPLAVAAFLVVNTWAQAPAAGIVHNPAPTATPASQPAFQPLETALFKTRVPAGWRIQNNQAKNHSDKIQLVAFATTGTSSQLAIVSDRLPTDGLKSVADYHLRASSPADYATLQEPDLPAEASIFQKKTGSPEYALFMSHNQDFVSLTVTGERPAAALLAILKQAIEAWRWAL